MPGAALRQRAACGLLLAVLGCCPVSLAETVTFFDIEAQPMTGALLEFSSQSGVSVGFAEAMTADKTGNRVRGHFLARSALRLLLEDSGLAFHYLDDESIVVTADEQPDENNASDVDEVLLADDEPAADADAMTAFGAPLSSGEYLDEVIVLGSHIAGASINESLPVTIWEPDRMQAEAAIDGGDLFRALPFSGAVNFNGVDTFFAGVNSARGDIASINLRELGTGNTLVLLNGRRMVTHPGVQTEGRVPAMTANMNLLPVNSLARVEILRDGASAIYGADAVAGVVNNVLRSGFDGVEVSAQAGVAEGSSMTETELNLHLGGTFNDGRDRFQVFAALAGRSGVDASEHWFSRSSNLQPLLAGTAHADNSNFNNNSINGSWGQFRLPVAVTMNGSPVTSAAGIFHLQPAGFDGCIVPLDDTVCIDDSLIDTELYGDHNSARQLIPDLKRSTVIVTGEHKIANDAELYGELVWYEASSRRMTGAAAVLPTTPITIPASNYWNPFGPVTFSDGRTNPNRLPGIDAPAEGLSIQLDSSFFGSAYRVADAGPREITIDNRSVRALAGARGEYLGWFWDSALLYSTASTDDRTSNRVSNSLFQQSLALETPQAYNPFNGSGALNPSSIIDAVPNPADVITPFLVDVSRYNEMELTMADLRASMPELLNVGGRPAGVALGFELRHEKFFEDRDDRFDGTITFTDVVTGQEFESDVMGSSVTADSEGSRRVISVFSEVELPLVGVKDDVPLIQALDVHVAARYEDYTDVGGSFQPRVAFSWRPARSFLLRGSYSRGVRVPNLPQLNAGLTRRVLSATDWYRCQALLNKGEIASLGSCGPAGQTLVESSRSGSQTLQPEDYRSMSVGALITPVLNSEFVATIDFWKIKQDGIVGLFGAENQIAVDFVERLAGGSNAFVERAAVTQTDIDVFAGSGLPAAGRVQQINDSYVNLDRRISSGIDLSLSYRYNDWSAGALQFDIDATRLISADQALPAAAQGVNDLNEPAIAVVGGGNLLRRDSRPLWRAAAYMQFERGDWRVGINGQYVSNFFDTSAMNDASGGRYVVDHMLTVGAHWEYATSFWRESRQSIRIGVKNLFDEDPPLADEAFGFNAAMHSSIGRYWYLKLGAGFQ